MGEINIGPSGTQHTLGPAEGVALIPNYRFANDLSLAFGAHPLRIEAPNPGRLLGRHRNAQYHENDFGLYQPFQRRRLYQIRFYLFRFPK